MRSRGTGTKSTERRTANRMASTAVVQGAEDLVQREPPGVRVRRDAGPTEGVCGRRHQRSVPCRAPCVWGRRAISLARAVRRAIPPCRIDDPRRCVREHRRAGGARRRCEQDRRDDAARERDEQGRRGGRRSLELERIAARGRRRRRRRSRERRTTGLVSAAEEAKRRDVCGARRLLQQRVQRGRDVRRRLQDQRLLRSLRRRLLRRDVLPAVHPLPLRDVQEGGRSPSRQPRQIVLLAHDRRGQQVSVTRLTD